MKIHWLPIMVLAGGLGWAGEPLIEQTTLFKMGDGGYYGYRIPSVVVTKKGTVLAFFEGRKNSLQDVGNNDLLMIRSLDSGKTWTKPQLIADHGDDAIMNPCALVDQKTGTVWLMLTGVRADTNDKALSAGTRWHTVWITQSKDDGAHWAKPVEITSRIRGKHADMTFYAAGPGNGIQLRSGRLVFPNYFRWKGAKRDSYANAIYSDDHGKSWVHGNPAGALTNEAQMVELADGSLLYNMRSYHGKNRRAVARSRDGGQSWTEPVLDDTLVEPVCQASLIRLTLAGRRSKNRLLFSNPAGTKRVNMTVRLSYDEGRTWPVQRVLNAGPSGYSSLVALPDGTIGCLYESGDSKYNERLTFARFNLEWLSGGADSLKR